MIFELLLKLLCNIVIVLSIVGVYFIFRNLIRIRKLDELEKQVIYETFSLSFIIILGITFVQFVFSFTSINLASVISPEIKNRNHGAFVGDGELYINSFFFYCFLLCIVYVIKRIKYGTISRQVVLKQLKNPIYLIFLAFVALLVFITLSNPSLKLHFFYF